MTNDDGDDDVSNGSRACIRYYHLWVQFVFVYKIKKLNLDLII